MIVLTSGRTTPGATPTPSHLLDLGALPQGFGEIVGGSRWRYPFWYRDPGFGTFGSDLSDGLLVGFQP